MWVFARRRRSISSNAPPANYGFKAIEPLDIPVSDKVTLIYRRFADLSELKTAAEARYRRIRQALRTAGWTLPEWRFKGGGRPAVADLPLLDDITADVTRAPPGDMFFVHLLNRIFRTRMTRGAISARCETGSRKPGASPPNDRESR